METEKKLYYCEKCNMLNKQNYCLICGKRNLRNPENNDFCFLVELKSMIGEMFGGILKVENIPFSAIPYGNGARVYSALKLENLKIFVPYEFFNKAKELLDEISNNYQEEQKSDLIKNIDKLFVSSRNEKKIRKILKLIEKDSIIDYCADKILNADKIINEGKITKCIKGGNYLFVYKGNEIFVINSSTYEIISVNRNQVYKA